MTYVTGYFNSTDNYRNNFLFCVIEGNLSYVIRRDFITKNLTCRFLHGIIAPSNSKNLEEYIKKLWNKDYEKSGFIHNFDIPHRWFD